MGTGEASESLAIRVLVAHAQSGRGLAEVAVEVFVGERVIADGVTDSDGLTLVEIPGGLWREALSVRVVGDYDGVEVGRNILFGEEPVRLDVTAGDEVDRAKLGLLADYLVATRRVIAGDLADDLARPAQDSMSPRERARLLDELRDDVQLVDPDALREEDIRFLPRPDLGEGRARERAPRDHAGRACDRVRILQLNRAHIRNTALIVAEHISQMLSAEAGH